MDVDVISPAELGETELAAWRAMQDADPAQANPFLAPEFTLAVGRARPAARVAVLSEGGRPVGFFPFERRALGLGLPIGAGLCDCQGLIHVPGFVWDPVALLRECGLHLWRYDHLSAGQSPFETRVVRHAASPVIELADGYGAYEERLRRGSAGFLRVMRMKERRLERRAGELRMVFEESDTEVLGTLMRWKSAQYRAKGRVDQFARPWIVELLRDLVGIRSSTCSGTLSALYAGGRPVACHFGLRSRHVLSYWFPAYDPGVSRCSPGLLLLLKMAESAAARGIDHIDLGKGEERYKDTMKTAELSVAEGWADRRTTPAALRRIQAESAGRLRGAVAANPLLRPVALRTFTLIRDLGGPR